MSKTRQRQTSPQRTTAPVRVIVVDDHPIVREGLHRTISRPGVMEVCGEAEDAAGGLVLFMEQRPDLAIVDIGLPGASGLDLIRDVRARGLKTRILVLSVHAEVTYAERSLQAGADGYLLKQDAPDTIHEAIEKVLGGEVYVPTRMASQLLARLATGRPSPDRDSPVSGLTDRELGVLERVGRGLGTREIATELALSVSTVESHKSNIKTKLGLTSAPALHQFAAEWVLADRRPLPQA